MTRCDAVIARESSDSRPVVTVLVTRLPRRSKQDLNGHSFALVDGPMNPPPLVERDSNPCLNRDHAFAKDLATLQAVQAEKWYGTQTSAC